MNVLLYLHQPDDWNRLLPLLEQLKISFQIERQPVAPFLNNFQKFLLTAPVATAEDLKFIEDKKQHFNSWN